MAASCGNRSGNMKRRRRYLVVIMEHHHHQQQWKQYYDEPLDHVVVVAVNVDPTTRGCCSNCDPVVVVVAT